MTCQTCKDRKDDAYNRHMINRLESFRSANPCVCGETDPQLFENGAVAEDIWDQRRPWKDIAEALGGTDGRCIPCRNS